VLRFDFESELSIPVNACPHVSHMQDGAMRIRMRYLLLIRTHSVANGTRARH